MEIRNVHLQQSELVAFLKQHWHSCIYKKKNTSDNADPLSVYSNKPQVTIKKRIFTLFHSLHPL